MVCDKPVKAMSLLSKAKDTPKLKCIIIIEGMNKEVAAAADKAGVELLDFQNLLVRIIDMFKTLHVLKHLSSF